MQDRRLRHPPGKHCAGEIASPRGLMTHAEENRESVPTHSMIRQVRFRDRSEAGRLLARKLTAHPDRSDLIVVALSRSGITIGYEIAPALRAPLRVLPVCQLSVPGQKEPALGSVAPTGVLVLDRGRINALRVPHDSVRAAVSLARLHLRRQENLYRSEARTLHCPGRTIILVDDGVMTGTSLKAAVLVLRQLQAKHIILAVPVAPAARSSELQNIADDLISIEKPEYSGAVSDYYDDFTEVSDETVRQLLGHRVMDDTTSIPISGGLS